MQDISQLQNYLLEKDFSQIFLLVDSNTSVHCMPILLEKVDQITDKQATLLEIEAGEKSKSLKTVEDICLSLLQSNADRHSVIINLGGGVVCDIGGFAASIYKRGIACINVPTTLLAMVDASIGGKTAVDMQGVKNAIGCFNTDIQCFLDTQMLDTLNKEQILNGLAEMLKTFLIGDRQYLSKLLDIEDFTHIDKGLILRAIQIKEDIVAKDFLDKGIRKQLNFGHTLGHAFEALSMERNPEQHLLHGQAVAMGMYYALQLSEKHCGLQDELLPKVYEFLRKHYPIWDLQQNKADLMPYLLNDKKNQDGNLSFILLEKLQQPGNVTLHPILATQSNNI